VASQMNLAATNGAVNGWYFRIYSGVDKCCPKLAALFVASQMNLAATNGAVNGWYFRIYSGVVIAVTNSLRSLWPAK